jgi:hypothetical protein
MPVKISDQSSDPRAGVINKQDMDDATKDFQDNVSLTSSNPPIHKTDFCEFKRMEVLQLLGVTNANLSPGISGIRIYFGVHPDGQESCDGEDYSNRLNTMIFAIDDDGKDLDQIGQQMLIPGYNTFGQGAAGACCGGMGRKSGGG